MKTLLSADSPAKRIALYSMLLAAALMISYAESLLPPIIPGMKPGLANLAVMAAMCISPAGAAGVSAARVLICALLFGNALSFAMSAAGAICSLAVLLAVRAAKPRLFSWVGVSVLSALAHNAGQLAVALFIVGSRAALGVAPILVLSSLVCGGFSGAVMNSAASVIARRRQA